MVLDATDLVSLLGAKPADAARYAPYLAEYLPRYGITTPERLAVFLTNVKHETGNLSDVDEFSGNVSYFDAYEPGTKTGRNLGNTMKGDGYRFRGRGLPQLTGRDNYTRFSTATGINAVKNPDLLLQPRYAVLSSCWFWADRRMNALADAEDFSEILRRWTGSATRYYAARRPTYDRLLPVLRELEKKKPDQPANRLIDALPTPRPTAGWLLVGLVLGALLWLVYSGRWRTAWNALYDTLT